MIQVAIFILIILLRTIFHTPSSHGATFSGTATATVVDDLFTTSCDQLSFGRVEAGSGDGIIRIAPEGKIEVSDGVKADTKLAKPSRCSVKGKANISYHIKAPSALTFQVSEPAASDILQTDSALLVDEIQVISENKQAGDFTGKTNQLGEDRLFIGATIHVTKNTAPGLYQGYVPITVYY